MQVDSPDNDAALIAPSIVRLPGSDSSRIVLNRSLPAGLVSHGRSATISYFRLLRRVILLNTGNDHTAPLRCQDSFASEARTEPLLPEEELYAMPERQVADHLVAVVKQVGYMRWPVFPQNTFPKIYEGVYEDSADFADERPLAFALVHYVFAIGHMFLREVEKADLHYRKAKQLTSTSTTISLLTGQIGFLNCYYSFCSTPSLVDERLQRDTAEAVNLAIMLGLHNEPVGYDRETAESRKRLWYALVRLDVAIGVMLGRPLMSKAVKATCTLPTALPGEAPEDIARFRALMTLSESWLAVTKLYDNGEPTFGTLHAMVAIERDVEQWRRTLHPALEFHIDKDDALGLQVRLLVCVSRRSYICAVYLFTRIVIFRPALERKLDQTPNGAADDVPWRTLEEDAWERACLSGIEAARRLIRHMAVAKIHLAVAGSSVFTVDCLFAASSILLSAKWLNKWTESMSKDYDMANEMLHETSPAIATKLNAVDEQISKSRANRESGTQRFGDVLGFM